MASCSKKLEVADAGEMEPIADDKVSWPSWVMVQDNSGGEPRLMTQAELEELQEANTQEVTDFIGPNVGTSVQEPTISTMESINNGQTYTDMNNNNIQETTNIVTSTYRTDDEIETLRCEKHDLSMDKELNYRIPGNHIELVMDEDLDSSLTNDGNLLEHISRQIAIQQPYLNPDSSGQPMTYHIEEIPLEALDANSFSDSFTVIPNMMNHPQQTWYQACTTSQPVDLRVMPQKNSFEPVIYTTPTSHNQKRQQIQYIPARNSTPVTMHSILQPIGTNESGRYVYTPHPKTGQYMYVAETSSPMFLPQANNISKPQGNMQTQSKATNTCKKTLMVRKFKSTPEPKVLKKVAESPKDDKENGSPDRSKSPRQLELDFPLFMSCGGEESRAQHNLKERKRRARIKDACEVMRKLVPGMSDKTDKATVFEFAARYIHFLKGFTGNKHDKDFLLKYSPY